MDNDQWSAEPSMLHLDILELILQEHRNDHATLAASALASHSLLQIARKFLYRSVSLDYCENPYGYEQQRKLRSCLSANPHLCSYVRSLRLSLTQSNKFDPVLSTILRGLARVETLHVIGPGMDARETIGGGLLGSGVAYGEGGGVSEMGAVDEALMKVFAQPSLRKVTLDNIYPLSDMYVSRFTELKHLELLSVGCGPPSASALQDDESSQLTADASILSSSSAAASSHLPSSPPSSDSSSSLTSSSTSSSLGSWYLGLSTVDPQEQGDRQGTPPPLPPLPSASGSLAVESASPPSPSFLASCTSSQAAQSQDQHVRHGSQRRRGRRQQRQRKVHLEYLVLNVEHLRPILDVICHGGGGGTKQKKRGEAGLASTAVGARKGKGWDGQQEERDRYQGSGLGEQEWTGKHSVDLGSLDEDEEGSGLGRTSDNDSILDFSCLKEAHVYVWDPDDSDGIWAILHSARKALERLTLRYFQYGDEHVSYHHGFDNLQSLILGTHTFSIKDDPFRSLVAFFKDPTKFPALRTVKISFDLWGCESSGTSWLEVSGYRGWGELDAAFAAFDDRDRCRYNAASGGVVGSDMQGSGSGPTSSSKPWSTQLTNIIFELWCSSGYKAASRPSEDLESDRDLLVLIKDELSYLRHNPSFVLI